jgi:hypothetical protein
MERFKTKDIYEASALIATNANLITLEADRGFYWFVFENATSCRKVSDSYWSNRLTILAKSYAEAIRSLKDRIFASK